MFLKGKKILVTGGTSRLGREIVKKASAAGAEVFFTYLSQSGFAKELETVHTKAFSVDLSDIKAMDAFVFEIKNQIKVLDVVIHNAAAVRDHTLQNLTEEEWDYVMAVDLKAPYYLTKKLMPLLFRSQQAKILFLTSRTAFTGGIGISNYAAAKAGLVGLTRSLAKELGGKKILVNAINPGFMESRMTQGLPEEVKKKHLEVSPLGQVSNPEEVADFILYLCSNRMTQVTGQVFHFESRSSS